MPAAGIVSGRTAATHCRHTTKAGARRRSACDTGTLSRRTAGFPHGSKPAPDCRVVTHPPGSRAAAMGPTR